MALTQEQKEFYRKKYNIQPTQPTGFDFGIKKTPLQRVGGAVERVLGPASRFMFGTAARGIGTTIGAGVEAGQELITGKPAPTRFRDIAEETFESPAETAKLIAGTALEGTVGGFGEKLVAKVGTKVASPLIKRAEKLYQSALKPTEAVLKKAPDVVKTGLKEKITVSKRGLEKTANIMEDIGESISKVIDEGVAVGKSISKKNILPYLDEMKSYLKNVIDEKDLVKEADELGKKFLQRLTDEIPIEKAQELKKATQNFIKKTYNREAPLKFEVQKQITRGLKEEIAKEVPEIAKLNARDRALFGLEEALERSVKRMGNRNIIGLGDMFAIGGGGATAGPQGAALLLMFKKLLYSPQAQSGRAILFNELGKNGAKAFEKARVPVALGIARLMDLLKED